MQKQMKGGGIQEMMKTMMQGQGGDQLDMEEMQREDTRKQLIQTTRLTGFMFRNDVPNGRHGWARWTRRPWWPWRGHVRYVKNDGNGWGRALIGLFTVHMYPNARNRTRLTPLSSLPSSATTQQLCSQI